MFIKLERSHSEWVTSFNIYDEDKDCDNETLLFGDVFARSDGSFSFYWIFTMGTNEKKLKEERVKQLVLEYYAEQILLE